MTDEAGTGSPGRGMHGRGHTHGEARIVLVERLRARRAEIDEEIFARVSGDAFGSVGAQDAEYVAGLRVTVAATVDYGLQGIERGEEWAGPIPVVAVEQARRAARAGVSLDTVLRRYVLGSALLGECIMEEADRDQENWTQPTQRGALREALRAQAAALDRLIAEVSRAYGEGLERTDDSVQVGSGGSGVPPGRVVGTRRGHSSRRGPSSRRDRILEAMAEVAAERGFENVTVKLVTARAGVSTRTFYEEFDGLQDCFLGVLDLGLERAGELITRAYARVERWQDGVLGALASLLQFFDSEPVLARVWFVEAMAAGSRALERRERIAEALRSMIVEYWAARGEEPPEPVAAAGVMASVLGLIQTHLVTEQSGPLIELLGPLMGLVTSLYLDKEDRAREVRRGAQLAQDIQTGDSNWSPPGQDSELELNQRVALPAMLANPSARRARECLLFLAEQNGRGVSPSNHEIAAGIGVTQQAQISRLLSSLVGENLVTKGSEGIGKRNALRLTPRGEEIARMLSEQGA